MDSTRNTRGWMLLISITSGERVNAMLICRRCLCVLLKSIFMTECPWTFWNKKDSEWQTILFIIQGKVTVYRKVERCLFSIDEDPLYSAWEKTIRRFYWASFRSLHMERDCFQRSFPFSRIMFSQFALTMPILAMPCRFLFPCSISFSLFVEHLYVLHGRQCGPLGYSCMT